MDARVVNRPLLRKMQADNGVRCLLTLSLRTEG